MFRAFVQAAVGFGDQEGHVMLRARVVNWMRQNHQLIEPLLDSQEVEEYVEGMAEMGRWAGAPELFALSQMCNLKISVLVKGNSGYSWSVVGSGEWTILLSLEGRHYENLVSQREL